MTRHRHIRSFNRGFTLIELLVVVAMVGILSTLAVVGYRKYIVSSKTSEAVAMCQGIRSAEESYRAETMGYLNVSTSNTYYPRNIFDSKKASWVFSSHADYARWLTINVQADGPVRFNYKVNAGPSGGTVMSGATVDTPGMTWPAPVEPWYVVQARGNPDEEGPDTLVIGSSFTGELRVSN